LQQFVGLTSTNAARIFDLYPQKGAVEVGADADLVVWNPKVKSLISVETQLQKCDANIYEGMEINGEAEYVLSRCKITQKPGRQ